MRLNASRNLLKLAHQAIINLQTTSRINNDQVVAIDFGLTKRVGSDVGRRDLRAFAVYRNVELLAQRFQLFDRGRAVDVGGNQQWGFAFFPQMQSQFCRHRGFTSTLQTHQHDNRRLFALA